jgi:lipoate---protein ligase
VPSRAEHPNESSGQNLPSTKALRFLDLTLPGIAANLALDEALLIAADEHGAGPVLRLWEPQEFAVVLGATSRLRDDVYVERCRAEGVAIARRTSGGGTVVVGPGTLNVSVVLPSGAAPGLAAVDTAHKYVLDRFAAALRVYEPAVEVLGLGDLTLGGRKFSGSAQRRLRHYFLVHVTILYRFPLERIAWYTALPRRQPSYRAQRAHDDFLVNLTLSRDCLRAAIRSAWFAPGRPVEAAPIPEAMVRHLVATKFALPVWVERL